jgi:hypothetical protein
MIYRGIFGDCEYSGNRVTRYSVSHITDEKGNKIMGHIWIDCKIVPELKNEFKPDDIIEFWAAKMSNADTGVRLVGFKDFKKVSESEIKE